MKLSPRQEKIFHSIMKLKLDFNRTKDSLLGNQIIKKCDYLLQLFYDEKNIKTVFDKQTEYEIKEFVNDTKDYINNVLGVKNEK